MVNAGASALTFGVAIRRRAGAGTPLLKLVDFTDGAGTVNFQYPVATGTIWPGAATAAGVVTVAASRYSTPTVPEAYSSRGPVVQYFDAGGSQLAAPETRQKPDIASADAVATGVTGFSAFQGTSAATPAAAGIAALIRSARPAMPVDELYAIMRSPANAFDCPAIPGVPDIACGAGFDRGRQHGRHGARPDAAGRHAGARACGAGRRERLVSRTRRGHLGRLRRRVARRRSRGLRARGRHRRRSHRSRARRRAPEARPRFRWRSRSTRRRRRRRSSPASAPGAT